MNKLAERSGRPIDIPLAGVLGEGTHVVRLAECVRGRQIIVLTFEALNGTGTHLEKVNLDNQDYLTALDAVLKFDENNEPILGQELIITLAHSEGYRIIRAVDGYRAQVGEAYITCPYGRLTDIEADMEKKKIQKSVIEVSEYDLYIK